MGIGTPSYLGNGGFWWRSAPAYGAWTTRRRSAPHSPSCPADGAGGTYGHVAVVEAVYGDGTFRSPK